MASMCDEMSVIYEDGVENGLESVVERLAEERDRITSDLQKWFVNHKKLIFKWKGSVWNSAEDKCTSKPRYK